MDAPSDQRHDAIATALTAEIDRQAQAGASRIDVDALAQAVEDVIAPSPPLAEGKRPSELNSTNDD
ncbi:hypothetical protein [Devosia rhizoryzae]|uniref:Uncharacterized protein n=1 Tax=Devosia rhizoryzae TaxID=2774137 RepID=A0ABX7C822_9HYPH|nr:hypothetical protein [Devosia rhizoryzae]QQR38770.1 hypothetical protein JI748_13560 [Devosia rhizoryzae]